MKHVWVFDPGETTGWIHVVDNVIENLGTFVPDYASEVLKRIEEHQFVLYETLHCSPGFRPIGFEVIGAIKYVCVGIRVVPLGHSPMNMAGPMKWPELDPIRKVIKSPHIRDAIYHYASWSEKIPLISPRAIAEYYP